MVRPGEVARFFRRIEAGPQVRQAPAKALLFNEPRRLLILLIGDFNLSSVSRFAAFSLQFSIAELKTENHHVIQSQN